MSSHRIHKHLGAKEGTRKLDPNPRTFSKKLKARALERYHTNTVPEKRAFSSKLSLINLGIVRTSGRHETIARCPSHEREQLQGQTSNFTCDEANASNLKQTILLISFNIVNKVEWL